MMDADKVRELVGRARSGYADVSRAVGENDIGYERVCLLKTVRLTPDLTDACEALLAERAELQHAADNWRAACEGLKARVAELEAGLKRFAEYARHFPLPHVEFETVLMEVTDAPNITFGDCRRAAELLAPKGVPGG